VSVCQEDGWRYYLILGDLFSVSLAPYRVMLAVSFYPHGFDFIFRLGYIVRVASNTTLLFMPALLGYCRRNGRFSHDCPS